MEKLKRVGRPRKRLSRAALDMAASILNLDVARGGVIWRARCPEHGVEDLSYYYGVNDGVYVYCECGWRAHYPENKWQH